MKLKQEKIVYPVQSSFKVLKYSVPYFDMPFHYHPEYELVYVTRGSGLRYIGTSIKKFQEKDMVFLGPDLSHQWINTEEYRKNNPLLSVEAVVVQFPSDLFSSVIDAPEFCCIRNLLNRSRYGLRIEGNTRVSVAKFLQKLLSASGVEKFILLLKMLETIAKSDKVIYLNNPDYISHPGESDARINAVCSFTLAYYNQKIGTKDAAMIANMEQSAFCRFFREKTRKTYMEFLTGTRIDQACRLLLQKELSISQIAYETGFNNMANFYKQFKKITGLTPNEYRKE